MFKNEMHNRKNTRDEIDEQLDRGPDALAEELLDNINTTPIGRLLKRIAAMPEIRRKKVSSLRRQLNRGEYDLNTHLDAALDKVLEELLM
jgi:hypothetical protein